MKHKSQSLLSRRLGAQSADHAHKVFKVLVLEHLHDSRRERGDGELGNRHEFVLRDESFVLLVERAEALIQRLDLARGEFTAAVLLNVLDVVLREIERARGETHGGERFRARGAHCGTRVRRPRSTTRRTWELCY